MFDQAQIHEFKEAFNMIDQNRDGFVDKDDLIEMMTSLGKNPTDEILDAMVQEAPGPINFTMFLTLFGDKLSGTDPEDVIVNAFACFDEKHTGQITEDRLREVMTTMGDRWTDDMVDELFLCSPISSGHFHYVDFVRAIKHGTRRDADDDSVKAAAASAPIQAPKAATPTPAPTSGGGGGSGKAPTTPSVALNADGVVHV